jgi:hypothetical protein
VAFEVAVDEDRVWLGDVTQDDGKLTLCTRTFWNKALREPAPYSIAARFRMVTAKL